MAMKPQLDGKGSVQFTSEKEGENESSKGALKLTEDKALSLLSALHGKAR
jgi:hypothetical protein